MCKKKRSPDAIRVNSKSATIPKPTPEMIEEIAQGIYVAVTTSAVVTMSCDDAMPWAELNDTVRDFWLSGARSAYAVIAIHGGGKVEPIEDAK